MLTNTLILQPEFEVNLYSKSDPARLVGAGISDCPSSEFSRQRVG
jgi:copper resistance protein B